jgi:ribosomal subunit interface protein
MNDFDINNIQLKIQSPEITVNDGINNLIIEHIEKLGRLFNRITKCEMMLRIENNRKHTCEADVKIFVPGNMLFATGKAADFVPAINEAFHDVHEQLMRYKDKLKDKPATKPDNAED